MTVASASFFGRHSHTDAAAVVAQDGFFYSYTYNLAATLQANMEDGASGAAPFDSMFVWNEFLTRFVT